MRFASRTDFDTTTSHYGEALRNARTHPDFLDLTLSNPTQAGISYSAIALRELSTVESLRYNADALGIPSARQAVAACYADIPAQHILLSASTSEAYGYLLRLLCEPGDQILVPSPSYPLFDLLARLHDVELVTYPLVYHDGWQIEPASLNAAITERTRAIVAIHPNNPTGHFCSAADQDALYAAARAHGLPLIVDEVFLDYALEGGGATFADRAAPTLTFVLGGLSKALALPQMKLAWTVVCGPDADVEKAMDRLEVIADTFLSVATPVQCALPAWMQAGEAIREQLLDRMRTNCAFLDAALKGSVVSRLRTEGGWSTVLRVPAIEDDEVLAVRLLREHNVATHPGSFYGFPSRGWLIISLIVPVQRFTDGIRRLLDVF